ncbi:hypothetical protein UCRPC4_g01016 [Phaeomoniella chlamydospora]|uniref:Uncharacterized protein n=1 Tax=Phaeomoniella chlamydospora TaxID=158046 RepID=A0A0G2EZM6_PHACM|nr:hypothetical protein UCRPC4_g01016 [Phaeomoniella chlamydospora]
MQITTFTFSALVLASELSMISAKSVLEVPTRVQGRHESLNDALRREAFQVVDPKVDRRAPAAASASSAAAAASSAIANFDTPEWNATTIAACTKGLSSVKSAENSAGMLACYNLPFLNVNTGVFQADLRLYQVNEMTGDFTGVQTDQLSLSLTYPDATVSETGSSVKVKRSEIGPRSPATSTVTQAAGAVNEIQQFQFVGQVDTTLTLTKIRSDQQMSLLIPTIKLSAPSAANSGVTVSTNLTSADTVYFVNGVFKGQSAAGAAAASTTAIAAASSSAALFVVPGINFGIFPIGFIITGIWTVLFGAVVGAGTIGRQRFRESYRNRVKRANTGFGGRL